MVSLEIVFPNMSISLCGYMRPKADSWTIVILGFWNRMIFTHKWVLDQLFHKQEVEMLVPMLPVAPLIYRDDELVLHITEQKIIVQTRKFDDSCLVRAEKMACEALQALPKTPVSAIGVNFGFVDSEPNDEVLKLFNFSDDVAIGSLDWAIGNKKITRQLTKDEMTLNLIITQDSPSNLEIDANFNCPVESADDAVKKITEKTIYMHESLVKLIKDVYEFKSKLSRKRHAGVGINMRGKHARL